MATQQTVSSAPDITVYWLDQSRAQRIIWLLEELSLPYKTEVFHRGSNLLAPSESKSIHPLGKFPMVKVNNRVLAESGFIQEYIVENFGPQLMPPREREDEWCRYRYFMHYAEGSLMTPFLMGLMCLRFKRDVPFFLKPAAWLIIGGVESAFLSKNYDNHLSFLEGELAQRPYLCGEAFSNADILTSFPLLLVKDKEVVPAFKRETYPKIWEWLERLEGREAYKRAVEKMKEEERTGML